MRWLLAAHTTTQQQQQQLRINVRYRVGILLWDHRAAKNGTIQREAGQTRQDKRQPADLGLALVGTSSVCVESQVEPETDDSMFHASLTAQQASTLPCPLPTAHLLHPSRCVPPQA